MNVDEEHSLSVTSAEVPAGSAAMSGERAGAAFLDYIELNLAGALSKILSASRWGVPMTIDEQSVPVERAQADTSSSVTRCHRIALSGSAEAGRVEALS